VSRLWPHGCQCRTRSSSTAHMTGTSTRNLKLAALTVPFTGLEVGSCVFTVIHVAYPRLRQDAWRECVRHCRCTSGDADGYAGSSMNAMMFHAGAPSDYEEWARAADDPSWGYDGLRPYWRRFERHTPGDKHPLVDGSERGLTGLVSSKRRAMSGTKPLTRGQRGTRSGRTR
jgi:hypothetical protein